MDSYPTPRNPQIQNARPDPGTGGFLVSYADLQRSQAAVELDTKGFALAAGAGAAIGQGMQGLGEGLGQIAQAQFASINRKKVTEFDAKLDAASDAVAQKMAGEPDELKWPEIFHKEAEAWNKEFSKDTTLSPAARDAITDKFSAWKITSESSIKRASFDRTIQNEAKASIGAWKLAVHQMDIPKAAEIRQSIAKNGIIREDQLADMEIEEADALEKAEKEAKWSAEYALIQQDPDSYQKEHGAIREEETPVEHSRRINAAQEAVRERAYAAGEDVADYIVKNPGATEGDVEKVAGGRLRPNDLARWKQEVVKRHDLKVQLERSLPDNINAAFGRLLREADAFDFSKANGISEFTRIHQEALMLLPASHRGDVTEIIERKRRAASGDNIIEATDETKQTMRDVAKNMFENGEMGPFKQPKPDGSGTLIEDNQKKQDATIRHGNLMNYMMHSWLPANPNANSEEAREVMRAWMRGKAPVMQYSKPKAYVPPPDSADTEPVEEDMNVTPDGDLPTRSFRSQPDSPLIPRLQY